jgi:SdrD B-like domain
MSRTLVVTRIAGALVIFATLVTQGAGTVAQTPPPGPPRPGPSPDGVGPSCRAVVAGLVTREVGNLQNGPPRNAGIPRIDVQLLDAQGKRVARDRTDQRGRYSFRDVCAGTYTVCPGTPCPAGKVVPSRYSPETREVRVPPALQNGVDFQQLPPPPIKQ